MGRTCAWCGTRISGTTGTAVPVSHVLCGGCLEELQSALVSQGLRPQVEPHRGAAAKGRPIAP